MTTEYKTYTVSKVQTGYVFFEEITDFVSIQESLKGVKVGDKVRLGIDRSNHFGALVSAEIVKSKVSWVGILLIFSFILILIAGFSICYMWFVY